MISCNFIENSNLAPHKKKVHKNPCPNQTTKKDYQKRKRSTQKFQFNFVKMQRIYEKISLISFFSVLVVKQFQKCMFLCVMKGICKDRDSLVHISSSWLKSPQKMPFSHLHLGVFMNIHQNKRNEWDTCGYVWHK